MIRSKDFSHSVWHFVYCEKNRFRIDLFPIKICFSNLGHLEHKVFDFNFCINFNMNSNWLVINRVVVWLCKIILVKLISSGVHLAISRGMITPNWLMIDWICVFNLRSIVDTILVFGNLSTENIFNFVLQSINYHAYCHLSWFGQWKRYIGKYIKSGGFCCTGFTSETWADLPVKQKVK